MSAKRDLMDLIEHNKRVSNPVTVCRLAVTERTIRKALGLRKRDPLELDGVTIIPIGSKRWREARQ